ncbi:hypothetical protein IV203_028703 [Nitzschia inconspicua]|uniref:Uncharacterized protein n=1 Tax=Nitzschia inconspicua TaxID=303405 RepID=A0A9K3LQC0_9STRA|nr:hypothetical protein IV203_028703 [Nitzschia inconspicua]
MMRTTIDDTVSDSDDDDDDDDLFSPIEGRRSSLHDLLTPTTPASRETPPPLPQQQQQQNDSLPRLQDTSWIGAQVSPIPNNAEDEDNDHDDHHHQNSSSIHIGAPKFRSIQDYHSSFFTTGNSAAGGGGGGVSTAGPMVTEKTSLLGQQRRRHQHHNNNNNNNNNTNTTNLHQRNHTYKQQQQNQHSTLPVTLEEGPTPSIQHGQHLPSSSYPTTTSKKQHPTTFQSFKGRSNITIPPLRDVMLFFNHNNNRNKHYLHYFIPATTGIFLALVALHDIFLMYLSWRRGVATTYSLAWSWPWGSPSTRSLIRFGAYYYHQDNAPWWRLVTASLWVTNSVTEWLVLVLAWTWGISINNNSRKHNNNSNTYSYNSHQLPNHIGQSWIQSTLQQPIQTSPHHPSSSSSTRTPWYLHWSIVYTVSIMTGILWMRMSTKMMMMTNTTNSMAVYANDGEDTAPIVTVAIGCTSWGTAGVLCATGMQWPQRRFELFLLAMGLLLLKMWPQTSFAVVWAAIGSTFFGWAYASNFATSHPPNNAGVANNDNNDNNRNYNNSMGSPSSWHYYYDVHDGNFKETATKPAKMGKTWLRVAAAIATISLWFVPILVIWGTYGTDTSS